MFYGDTAHRTALCSGALGFTGTPLLVGVLGPILALFLIFLLLVVNLFLTTPAVCMLFWVGTTAQ